MWKRFHAISNNNDNRGSNDMNSYPNSSHGIGYLRDELVGHCTLGVLSLLGFALYTLTYSLVYSSSSSTPVVASLEMWMVSTHLVLSIISVCVQGLGVAIFKMRKPLPHVAAAQTSIFMGVALITTILGIQCIQQQTSKNEFQCTAFYGAAAVPQLSAVGTFAWAWVMYISSLGCQTWSSGGFTLGLTDFGCLSVASVLLLTPLSILDKLYITCDPIRNSGVLKIFCKNDVAVLCSGLWIPLILVVFGIILYGVGFFLQCDMHKSSFVFIGMILRLFGIFCFVVCCFLYIISANTVSGTYGTSMFVAFSCCLISCLDNLFYKKWKNIKQFETTNENDPNHTKKNMIMNTSNTSSRPLFFDTRMNNKNNTTPSSNFIHSKKTYFGLASFFISI